MKSLYESPIFCFVCILVLFSVSHLSFVHGMSLQDWGQISQIGLLILGIISSYYINIQLTLLRTQREDNNRPYITLDMPLVHRMLVISLKNNGKTSARNIKIDFPDGSLLKGSVNKIPVLHPGVEHFYNVPGLKTFQPSDMLEYMKNNVKGKIVVSYFDDDRKLYSDGYDLDDDGFLVGSRMIDIEVDHPVARELKRIRELLDKLLESK